ncbi:hypothetical protein GCM10009765_72220 [Fodinicola feengrottensis]|uniref:Uncharacterized protein n=1 Tax=Fodinicola feengrottensis TaxID=435914 RepID=A0ABN2IVM4_9ACTN
MTTDETRGADEFDLDIRIADRIPTMKLIDDPRFPPPPTRLQCTFWASCEACVFPH